MDLKALQEILGQEIRHLRADIVDLKRCQMQYFTLAVTSTGAILGLVAVLGNRMGNNEETLAMAVLAPLAVILPCWLVFFDKATTITRIVGYQRLLEKQLFSDTQLYKFIGYERSLAEFRSKEDQVWSELRKSKIKRRMRDLSGFLGSLIFATRHRYWALNWYTFLGLSLFSAMRAHSFLLNADATWWLLLGKLFITFCALYTAFLIWTLTYGRRSYDASAAIWEIILAFSSNAQQTTTADAALRPR